jgi:hypothetical protein
LIIKESAKIKSKDDLRRWQTDSKS